MQTSYMANSTTSVPCATPPLISHFRTPMVCSRPRHSFQGTLSGSKVLKDMALVSVATFLTKPTVLAEACAWNCSDPCSSTDPCTSSYDSEESEETGYTKCVEPEPYVCACGSTNATRQSTASLTRAVGLLRPTSVVRTLQCTGRQPCSGPMSVLLVLFTTIMSVWAALRAAVTKRVKECRHCRGFGIERCHLCFGNGVLSWEGKYAHNNEPCPRCFGRRFVKCSSCGGHYHRPMFHHVRAEKFSLVKDLLELRPGEDNDDQIFREGQVPRMRTW